MPSDEAAAMPSDAWAWDNPNSSMALSQPNSPVRQAGLSCPFIHEEVGYGWERLMYLSKAPQ